MNLTQLKTAPEGSLIRDDEVTGLEFRVRDGRRAFYFYYRVKGTGQRRRPKIGDFPAMTIQQARDIAREWIGEIARGGDPSGQRAALRASETVSDLCDRYIKEHAHKRSARHDKGHVENTIKVEWGTKRVSEVSKPDVLALKRKMADRPIAFNRLQALVSAIWKFGEYPFEAVKKYPETQRKRYLTTAERERLEEAFDETEVQYPHAVALLRVLYLTGARFSEIARAKRSQYRDGHLYLTQHKTAAKEGPKIIVFPQEAREVVESISPRGGWLVGLNSYPSLVWDLVRERAKLKDFRLHDLRHSFASDALADGATLGEIGEVLGHRDTATTRRYAHLSTEGKQAVVDRVARRRKAEPTQ
jgi:integrase